MWTVSLLASGMSTATNSTPALHQRGNEGQIARQPVELGNHQLRLLPAAGFQRLRQLRPIAVLAALDLGELRDQLGIAVDEVEHRRPLRLEAKTAAALPIGRNAVVRDEAANCW